MTSRLGIPPGPAAGAEPAPPRQHRFAALEAPYFVRLWMSGWLWNVTRWMGVFLGSYLVNDLTGSPFLVQLVGGAFFAPMFLGGLVAGTISDRCDRRRTILWLLALLIPVAITIGAIIMAGQVRVWMIYPVMLAIGAGGVIDMTSRRALIYDIVGEGRVTNAFALESLSMSVGNMLGAMLGGAVITLLGIGPAFLFIAACYAGAFAFLFTMPSPPTAHRTSSTSNFAAELRSGIAYVRRDRPLVSILGVTVLMNLFFFSFIPMVPVFADRMGVNALLTGVLASGTGIGMVLGSLVMATRQPRRRGLVYVGGSFIALSFLAVFAAVAWYPLALLALVLSGIGSAGFGAMQGVLVMVVAGPEMRGRAMGLLSMAIGGLPFGMVMLGLAAQGLGAPLAVVLSVTLGLVTMAAWLARRPEAARIA